MKTISLKQLHARTGHWARSAKKEPIIVTDRGEQIITLQPLAVTDRPRVVFTRRDWSKLPSSPIDSTIFISEDRDGR